MGEFPRKSDGRRVFTVEFKGGVVQQLLKDKKTLAEVSRASAFTQVLHVGRAGDGRSSSRRRRP